MANRLAKLKKLLNEYGLEVLRTRKTVVVTSRSRLDKEIPRSPGVYWIETTMPINCMQMAISKVIGKKKYVRKRPPKRTKLIEQRGGDFYVVYSGTEEDMWKRLKQHLYNEGDERTAKLGCVIDKEPFSTYEWRVRFKKIDSYEFRYAVEGWWRFNRGWPAFCRK